MAQVAAVERLPETWVLHIVRALLAGPHGFDELSAPGAALQEVIEAIDAWTRRHMRRCKEIEAAGVAESDRATPGVD